MTDQSDTLSITGAAKTFINGFARIQGMGWPIERREIGAITCLHFPRGRKRSPFTEEFFVVEQSAPTTLALIRSASPGPRHYVTAIGADLELGEDAYRAEGYRRGWTETLMHLPLIPQTLVQPTADIRPVRDLADAGVVLTALGEPIDLDGHRMMAPAHLADATTIHRYAITDGEIAAFGRALVLDDHAYVDNIVTVPAFRRRGLAREIMHALQIASADLGASHAVLSSSEMGRNLYASIGYRSVADVWIYAPESTFPENVAE